MWRTTPNILHPMAMNPKCGLPSPTSLWLLEAYFHLSTCFYGSSSLICVNHGPFSTGEFPFHSHCQGKLGSSPNFLILPCGIYRSCTEIATLFALAIGKLQANSVSYQVYKSQHAFWVLLLIMTSTYFSSLPFPHWFYLFNLLQCFYLCQALPNPFI